MKNLGPVAVDRPGPKAQDPTTKWEVFSIRNADSPLGFVQDGKTGREQIGIHTVTVGYDRSRCGAMMDVTLPARARYCGSS